MGWDYALVHVLYTIPPAILFSIVLAPLLTRLDLYKIIFLVLIAVIWTTPWDSYLIRHGIWVYPLHAIAGPTLFRIPIEELFFFVIQTYNTSLVYLLLNQATLFPIYLASTKRHTSLRAASPLREYAGQIMIIVLLGAQFLVSDPRGTYLRLILFWAGPVLLLLWSLASQVLQCLPWTKTVLPIALPTVYLWIVDTIALRKGTWAISHTTKWQIQPWRGMELEEAVFFLLTNMLVVFGLVAFDAAVAVIDIFPSRFHTMSRIPTPTQLIQALLIPTSDYDLARLQGLKEALGVLRKKSRSFYLASSVFAGGLRIDLIFLYAFCRVADDLVDTSGTPQEARIWIERLTTYLEMKFADGTSSSKRQDLKAIVESFPLSTQAILAQLPSSRISSQPLYDLLDGFRTDLNFSSSPNPSFPIETYADLEVYAYRVASIVAILCLDLVYYHHPHSVSREAAEVKQRCTESAIAMGKALQLINIARDVVVDAKDGRCYLPTSWLAEEEPKLTPLEVVQCRGRLPKIGKVRQRVLHQAMVLYRDSVDAIEDLPAEARGGIRVAIEAYVEIGRVMIRSGFERVDADDGAGRKGTVPKWRRLVVAWLGMAGFRRTVGY